MCGNITTEQNNKMYDFNVEMCFNFSITTVFVCISENRTKCTRKPYFSGKIYGGLR